MLQTTREQQVQPGWSNDDVSISPWALIDHHSPSQLSRNFVLNCGLFSSDNAARARKGVGLRQKAFGGVEGASNFSVFACFASSRFIYWANIHTFLHSTLLVYSPVQHPIQVVIEAPGFSTPEREREESRREATLASALREGAPSPVRPAFAFLSRTRICTRGQSGAEGAGAGPHPAGRILVALSHKCHTLARSPRSSPLAPRPSCSPPVRAELKRASRPATACLLNACRVCNWMAARGAREVANMASWLPRALNGRGSEKVLRGEPVSLRVTDVCIQSTATWNRQLHRARSIAVIKRSQSVLISGSVKRPFARLIKMNLNSKQIRSELSILL